MKKHILRTTLVRIPQRFSTFAFLFVLLVAGIKVKAAPGAVNFNGASNYIDIGNILEGGQSYTKEAWIKAQGNTSYNIITGADNPFWLHDGHLRAAHGWQTGNPRDLQDPAIFPLNEWVYVAVTYDARTNTMKLYKNAELVATNTNIGSYWTSFQQVGAYNGSNIFLGDIDEVRVWNRALCAPELQLHMNTELQGNEPGLLVYYNFNVGLPGLSNLGLSSIVDLSGKGNAGVLRGFTLAGTVANIVNGKPFSGTYTPFVFPTATASSSIANNATILTANSASAYQWIKDTADIPNATAQTYNAEPGTYSVRITAANGCVNTSSNITVAAPSPVTGKITMSPNPTVDGQDSFTIYDGYGPQSVKLTATGANGTAPYTYKWSNGSTSSYIWVSPNYTTTYNVIIKDAQNRTKTVYITIEVEDVKDCTGKVYVCHSHRNNTGCSGYNNYNYYNYWWSYFSHQRGYTWNWDVESHLSHGDKLGRCGHNKSGDEAEAIDFTNSIKFATYPNPTKGELTVSLPEKGHTEIKVTDLMGKLITVQAFECENQMYRLNLSGVAPGSYVIDVNNGGAQFKSTVTKE